MEKTLSRASLTYIHFVEYFENEDYSKNVQRRKLTTIPQNPIIFREQTWKKLH